MRKRGKDMKQLADIITLLVERQVLPSNYKDHPLRGKYAGFRDCHIEPDWVLIYAVNGNDMILYRTGTHADILE
jgi:mRNA interferase YafQ